jgi:hypothetical protein
VATVVNYRSRRGSYRFHRCQCGTEWTVSIHEIDHSLPVSGDEVLDVHQLLADFEGRLNELTDPPGPA